MMKGLFVFLFCLLLLAPVTVMLLKINPGVKLDERRTLASFPPLEFSTKFTRHFSDWFDDHFGLREWLILSNSKIKGSLFGASIDPEKVMIGKDRWLFYNNSRGQDFIFKSYTHLNLYREKELNEKIAELERRKKWCDSAGIVYIKTFFPQAQTIYPEKLPFLMRIQIRDTLSKGDQILKALRQKNSAFRFVDVRPALVKAKAKHQVYRKLDTHWNDYGAFIGYQDFFNQCRRELHVEPLREDQFSVEWVRGATGDLVGMMGGAALFSDSIPVFASRTGKLGYTKAASDGYAQGPLITHCTECTDKRRVLIFRDSYTNNLYQFISPLFAEVIYIRTAYDQNLVTKLKPAIVLEFPAERFL